MNTSATWLAATKPKVHADSAINLRTTGCFHCQEGRNRKPVRPAAATTMIAIAAMPPVAPSPSVHLRRLSVITSPSSQVLLRKVSRVAMITMLEATGLQAAAKNLRRLLRKALASPVSP